MVGGREVLCENQKMGVLGLGWLSRNTQGCGVPWLPGVGSQENTSSSSLGSIRHEKLHRVESNLYGAGVKPQYCC